MIINKITNKLRFSITFKITVTYVLIFFIFSTLMSGAILGSYEHYIRSGKGYNYQNTLAAILTLAIIFGFILVIIIGSRASKRLLSPIDTMTKMVKNISINELDERLDVSGSKDELKDLAATFNNTLDRLKNSIELQNNFVSDASHELRTPISVIQGYANLISRWGKDDPVILEEAITSIKSEADSMKELIDKLLFLARGDRNTQRLEKSNFMLNEIIDEVIKETMLIDDFHKIINTQNDLMEINGDKNLFKEAIRIFIDNSIKYTPRDGLIKLDSSIQGNKAVISIEDNGIGIDAKDLPFIFNRFYRSDKSRTKSSGGTGLGLAIAKWIIDHHNSTVSIKSKINEGTKVIIEIPIN